MSTLLTVTDAGFRRDGRSDWLFRHLEFTVESGEMVSVTGKSGSGKSTLVNLLAGFAKPTEGMIRRNCEASVVLQDFVLYQDLTVRENLEFFYKINGRSLDVERWIVLSGLDRWERLRTARLPLGYQKMLQVVAALTRECPLLILDDPAQGMDGELRKQLNLILIEIAASDKGVLYVGELEQPCPAMKKTLNLQEGRLPATPKIYESYSRDGVGVKL